MALSKETLKNNLASRFNAINPTDGDVVGKVAEIIADEVDAYIRSQTISVETIVTGTCDPEKRTIDGSGSGEGTVS